MITGTLLQIPHTLDPEKFIDLFTLACIHLRFRFPILAVTIELGLLPIPILPSLVYHTTDYAGIEAWANEAVVVHRPSTAEEKLQSIEERAEIVRSQLTLQPLDVARCAKVTHLVLSGNGDQVAVLVYSAHAISDAHTELLVLRKELELINELVQAPYPLPRTHALHPAQLAWGEEVSRLPPCLHELYGVDIAAFEPAKGLATSGKLLRGYALSLDTGREHGDGLCPTHHTLVVLSPEESRSVYRAAKSQGWTVTHAVDAARHMAYMEMRRDYLEENRGKPIRETLHTNFLMPVDGRRRFVGPFAGKEFAGNATSGFVTIMPLHEPDFVPADVERKTYFWRKTRDLNQVQVFCKVADKLVHMYREADKEFIDTVEGITPLLMMGNLLSPDYPPHDLAPEGFSSVGILERILPNEHKLAGHAAPIRVLDWFVGLTMTRHIFSLQFSMHMWSFREQTHLSVIHSSHFSQAYTKKFLDFIKSTLLLFAEAYDPEAQTPPHLLDSCTCM